MSFAKGYALLKLLEGNESTVDPVPTWGGITEVQWNLYADAHGMARCWPPAGDAQITDFWRQYWNEGHCADFPEPCDSVVFQLICNEPPGTAIALVQCALGCWPDGVYGARETQPAVKAITEPKAIAAAILAVQVLHYKTKYGLADPFNGLRNRTLRVANAIRAGRV